MASVSPNTKKRKPEVIRTDKSSSPSTAAGDALDPHPATKKSTHSQEPPPEPDAGEKEGAGVDWISRLPDAVLGEIITLLPTKAGARTQILATRWRHVWRSAPLNLDDRGLPTDDRAAAGIISRILSVHQGPGRRFSLATRYFHNRPATVAAWLKSPALNNLQEISFRLPADSPFPFSATLLVVAISNCSITDITAQMFHFPQLRKLTLSMITVSDASLHSIVSGCPVLEYLQIIYGVGFHCLWIKSNSLRSIGIRDQNVPNSKVRLGELIIEDAPCLEKLLYAEKNDLDVSIISAPKLETLGCFYHHTCKSRLVIGNSTFQGLQAVSLSTVMCSVKILAFSSWIIQLDMVVGMMKCFPCLEKLYIRPFNLQGNNLWRRKHKNFIHSADIRLKTVVLGSYRGIKSQVNFASFFIRNAKELQVMRIEVDGCYYNNNAFFAEQHRALEMEKRASSAATLDFIVNTCCSDRVQMNHNHDLSRVNPFECCRF